MPSSSWNKPNIGTVTRYVRLTSGLMALGSSTQLGKSQRLLRAMMMSFGAMKVAEGVTGFCPLTAIMDRASTSLKSMASQTHAPSKISVSDVQPLTQTQSQPDGLASDASYSTHHAPAH